MDGNSYRRILNNLNTNKMVKSDGYYIGTEDQCNAYDSTVTTSENYQGTTKRWAEPRKHPVEDKWAIVKHIKYTDETMESVVELDASWNPTTDIQEQTDERIEYTPIE
jgi:hypothetical protein